MSFGNEEKREINCFICAGGGVRAPGGGPVRRHLISSLLRDTQTFFPPTTADRHHSSQRRLCILPVLRVRNILADSRSTSVFVFLAESS